MPKTTTLIAAAIAALVAGGALAQAPAAAPAAPRAPAPPYGAPITLEQAKAAIAAMEAEARKTGGAPTLAVVEPSGEIVIVEKGQGQSYGTVDIALGKARSAARFRAATLAFDPNRDFTTPGMHTGLGGVPIVVDGKIIGGIGQSGVGGDALAKVGVAALAGGR